MVSATNRPVAYDMIDRYIAEIYDQTETQRDDVALIISLIGNKPASILEPFCGHGRILIPLAESGHRVTGLDLSEQFLKSLDMRLQALPVDVQARVSFRRMDVIADEWPAGFDVVVLGANCLYELATAEEQMHCISAASAVLRPGGYLYLDNNHMEGHLDPDWQEPGIQDHAFPTGRCADGTVIKGTRELSWCDVQQRLVRYRKTVEITTADGRTVRRVWEQQTHAPSTVETKTWLTAHGFVIEALWGDRHRSPYSDESGRAIFWARKK